MSIKIVDVYECTAYFELSIDTNGWNFTVIYGRHVNGGYIAIPRWHIACEAGDANAVFYNTEKLTIAAAEQKWEINQNALSNAAEEIAKAIKHYAEKWEAKK